MHFILVSHGPYAASALKSAEMIVGKQENVTTLAVDFDTTLEGMTKEIKEVVMDRGDSEVIVFCDILGGTPSNASIRNLHEYPDLTIVTGFNLPILIESFMFPTDDKEQLLDKIRETHRDSLNIIVNEEKEATEATEEYEL